MPRKSNAVQTYGTNDDIRDVVPKIEDYARAHFGDDPRQIKDYMNRQRRKAKLWVDNQLERARLETWAKDNDKTFIEATYAAYLILRGTIRGERGEKPQWFDGYKEDAKEMLEDLKKHRTAKKDLSSTTSRFTRKRWMHQDYQAPSQVQRVPK